MGFWLSAQHFFCACCASTLTDWPNEKAALRRLNTYPPIFQRGKASGLVLCGLGEGGLAQVIKECGGV